MKVDKLRRLFGALEHPAHKKQQTKTEENQTREASRADNAVQLAPGLKQGSSVQEADAARAERVAQIKSDVRSGNYRAKSEDVAAALVRDLF